MSATGELPAHAEVLVVGAGFAGIAAAVKLRAAGFEDLVVIERAAAVGGTWRDNDYPGAACDVPSLLYSLSFAPNPDWSRSFSAQEEIRRYLESVVDRFGIRPLVHTSTALEQAAWDEPSGLWQVETSRGQLRARWLVLCTGGLSEPSIPDVPGLVDFQGEVWHSAQWRHDVDLAGKRVAVVGTGASAIQFLPAVARQADSVVLLQRTPAWILPRVNRRLRGWERRLYRRVPALQRLVRGLIFSARELYVLGFAGSPTLMEVPRRLALRHLERQVPDPELRSRLTPDYAIGCKRILLSNDFYPALCRPNVELVSAGLASMGPRTVVAADGSEHTVDVVVFGTGFRVTDQPIAGRLKGRDGRTLAEAWRPSMHAHRASSVPGFPNAFFTTGPNAGLGHNSQVFMIEAQVGYLVRALLAARRAGAQVLEVRPGPERAWNDEVQSRMRGTVWATGGCASWYLDAQGRNSVLWPRSSWRFWLALRRFDPASYRFERRPAGPPAAQAMVSVSRTGRRGDAGAGGP